MKTVRSGKDVRRECGRTVAFVVGTALILAGCGGASETGGNATEVADIGVEVPSALNQQGKFRVGVQCDYPGIGYLDESGENAGMGPDVARQLAKYAFGSEEKAQLVCVTANNRVAYLTSNRVDLLLAGLSITEDRKKIIDFSDPFRFTGSTVITSAETPDFKDEEAYRDKTILTLSGSAETEYVKTCLTDSGVKEYKGMSDAVGDMLNGRGFAVSSGTQILMALAANNPKVKLNGPPNKIGYASAAAVQKGQSELRDWINAALDKMKQDDLFFPIVKRNFSGPDLDYMTTVIPRPNQSPDYSQYTGEPEC